MYDQNEKKRGGAHFLKYVKRNMWQGKHQACKWDLKCDFHVASLEKAPGGGSLEYRHQDS